MCKYAQIEAHLLALEAAMKVAGYWTVVLPSDQSLASELPFCVDTLRFEQWLQFVFVPRLHQLIVSGATLPKACAIYPAAALMLTANCPHVRRVLAIITHIDASLSQP